MIKGTRAVPTNEVAVATRNAHSPRSAGWTLYKPERVAEDFLLPVERVSEILERNGFIKAVRIREALIRWKTRLLDSQRAAALEERALRERLAEMVQERRERERVLLEIRNILRLPREEKGLQS